MQYYYNTKNTALQIFFLFDKIPIYWHWFVRVNCVKMREK